jgi:hypothetical protein
MYWSIGVSTAILFADRSSFKAWDRSIANATASTQSASCIASFFDHAARAASISARCGSERTSERI